MQWFGRKARQGEAESRAIALIDEGNALEEAGNGSAARDCYAAALSLAPLLPRAHLTQGNQHLASGDVDAALLDYERAISLDPAYLGAYLNLGHCFLRAGDPMAACVAYRRAIAVDQGFVDAHVALGAVLSDLQRPLEAIDSYRAALAIRPGHVEVYQNLGLALQQAGRLGEAIEAHQSAVALAPGSAQAHHGLGNALKDGGQLEEAEVAFSCALAIEPDHLGVRSSLLFCRQYRAAYSPAQLLEDAIAWGRIATARATPYESWLGTPELDRVLRVGVVSGDLRAHPVGHFFATVASAFSAQAPITRLGIEWRAYVTAPCHDEVTQQIRSAFAAWTDVQGLSDQALAERIHADAIDILIDLSGHTSANRLAVFAWKPSPIQLSWLGYFATTGLAAMDGVIADPLSLPSQFEAHFVERIVRLPRTRLCYSPPATSPAVEPPPAERKGRITFGCFNHLSKINSEVIGLWAKILLETAGAHLRLKAPQLADEATRRRLVAAFEVKGIEPARLEFSALSNRFDFLAEHTEIDIALDPFPYPGGATTADALWMGVPVLTLAGDSFLARQGVGLLAAAGLTDWIAKRPRRLRPPWPSCIAPI